MATFSARKQDMPPPGGFKSLNYSRIPAKSYFNGPALIAGHLIISAGAFYLYYRNLKNHDRALIEMRSSILAVTPLLVAERDREYLKQLRRNRDAEEKLMSNVEGWEVGKWRGEPIYKTLPKDTLIPPDVNEYFVHSHPKLLRKAKNILLWD